MNRNELVMAVAEKTGMAKKDAESAVAAFLEAVTESLAKGEQVQLVGFGTFAVKERAKRKGHNPKTGEEMLIPASKAPAFKAGAGLKNAVK